MRHSKIVGGIVVIAAFVGLFALCFGAITRWNRSHERGAPIASVDLSLGTSSASSTEVSTIDTPVSGDEAASEASILFLGDIMLDRSVKIRSLRAGSRSYPFLGLPTGWIDSFDYAVANLEGPVTDTRRPPEKEIDFQFDPEVIPALQQTGIDAFSQANNHALDQGDAGYQDSVRRLRKAGFVVFGHQVQDGHISFATTTVQGKKFAFLGWNTTDNPLDSMAASDAIQHVRADADYVIAYLHWGPEYRDTPHQNEVETAQFLIREGVDVVIGGHPHWVQGIDTYYGKPIFWSLGNFVFDQDFSLRTKQGLAVGLSFSDDRVRAELFPMSIEKSQPALEEGEAKKQRLEQLSEISDVGLREAIRSGVVEFEL